MTRIALLAVCLSAAIPERSAAQESSRGAAPEVDVELRLQVATAGRAVACVIVGDAERTPGTIEEVCAAYSDAQDRFLYEIPPGACRVRYRFRYSPALAVEVLGEAGLRALEGCARVRSLHADQRGEGCLAQSRRLIGADRVETELGVAGAGRVLAFLDSGVDSTHPDLADALLHEHARHFLDQGEDVGPGAQGEHNHGSNVGGIMVSRGVVTPRGIAPEAMLIPVRVLDADNVGWIVDWTAGLEYLVDLHRSGAVAIDAINLSLATSSLFSQVCDADPRNVPLGNACRAAKELGIAVVAASGNNGSVTRIGSPACLGSTISVAAVHDTQPENLWGLSNRGALLDLLAPGAEITSAALNGGSITYRGTSQAAPHVTAVAALLCEVEPRLTPDQILGILVESGVEVFDSGSGLRYPRLRAFEAVSRLAGSGDCDRNGVRDYLETTIDGSAPDCNRNGRPDRCDIEDGSSQDCDGDGRPDECDIAAGAVPDLDQNGIPDGCAGGTSFNRADSNHDGATDISDSRFLLDYLFVGGAPAACLEAADVNNDGGIDIADAVYLLSYLFQGGPAPPGPGPAGDGDGCGIDIDPAGSEKDLGCERYERCASR